MDLAGRAGVVSAWLAALSVVIALLAWLLPRAGSSSGEQGSGQSSLDGRTQASAGPPGVPDKTAPIAPAAVSYLDDIAPQAAGDNIVALPRDLRDRPEYTAHAVAIECPSNETGDDTSNVTYELRGQYDHFDATVRPYYPPDADQRSVTYVFAEVGVREVDGELTRKEAGKQQRGAPQAPAPLSAVVEGAQQLTLKVACADPRGVVVLTDARLTLAD